MYISIDFDGTLVSNKWPEIGEEVPFCVETIKKFKEDGHVIILNTCREGVLLDDAMAWMKQKDIEPDYVNENPDANAKWGKCRKVFADAYIDDHNAFIKKRDDGSVDWLWIKRKYENKYSQADIVKKPGHYQTENSFLEAIDVLEEFNPCGHIWNALKYLMRCGKKAGESEVKDLKKAIWYINRRIENLQNKTN